VTTTVVIGPKTRVGRAVADRLRDTGEDVLLVARHAEDTAALSSATGGGVRVVDAGRDDLAAAVGDAGRLRVVVAALGPVHPGVPDVAADAAGVERDLRLIEQVLDTPAPTQVVLVSTILALAPKPDRRYYAGWKSLVEQQLDHLVGLRGERCTMSVLHPGRLASGRHPTKASFDRVAEVALSLDPDRAVSRLVGRDTRFWLLLRSISLASRSLLGAWGRSTTSARSVDRESTGGAQRG
jgi:hypothetical protein